MKYFRTTSKSQDQTAQAIFNGFHGLVTMSTDFRQTSGIVIYTYNLKIDDSIILKIIVNRYGKVFSGGVQ